MTEREIIGEGGFDFQKIKCEHCQGTGRCNCYTCIYIYADGIWLDSKEKADELSKKNVYVRCSKCNGFGFLILTKEGKIRKPEFKEEEEE